MKHITPNSLMRIAYLGDGDYTTEPACGAKWEPFCLVIVDPDESRKMQKRHRIENVRRVDCPTCRALIDVALERGDVPRAIAMVSP